MCAILGLCEFPFRGAGVNLGGWLVLEDWFFSGTSGSDFDKGREILSKRKGTFFLGSVLNMAESQFGSEVMEVIIESHANGSCVLNVSGRKRQVEVS